MSERLQIPGFNRGRRYANPQTSRTLIVYELEQSSVLTSPEHLATPHASRASLRQTVAVLFDEATGDPEHR